MNVYDVGDELDLIAEFRVLDELTDPEAVSCRVRLPDGTVQELVALNVEVGIWQATVVISQSGTWAYRFEGTGDAQAAQEGEFSVRRQLVP